MQDSWSGQHKSITVYVFVDVADSEWDHRVSERFFSPGQANWQQRVLLQPVFLDLQQAFDYIRFIGQDYVIIKALLPDSAVLGDVNGLKLKPGFLNLPRCQGLFMGWDPDKVYLQNPYFQILQASV